MIFRTLLDLLYPRVCAGCGGPVGGDDSHVCWDCLSAIQYVTDPYCSLCGDPVFGRVDEAFVCYTCSSLTPHFESARSAARYQGPLQEMLRCFKYRKGMWASADIARLLLACIHNHYDPVAIDSVAFVPLYPSRQRKRGYNQAEVLATVVARSLGKPLLRRCLARVRPTPSQTGLTAKARASNVEHAFKVRRRRLVESRSVLLIDDVMTTGATVNECARVLKEAGASQVRVATVARG